MTAEKIKPPHYYAGAMAVWGPWRPLSPGRMCYLAGFRWYRAGYTSAGNSICEFCLTLPDRNVH